MVILVIKKVFCCHIPQDIQEGKIIIRFVLKKWILKSSCVLFYLILHQIIKDVVLVKKYRLLFDIALSSKGYYMFIDCKCNLELYLEWFQFRIFLSKISITKRIIFSWRKGKKNFYTIRQELIKIRGYFLVYTDCHLDMKRSCLDSSWKRDNRTLVIIVYIKKNY